MDRVVVGMSGGVDSAVAAYLLKKEGYDVIGVYLKLHQSIDPLHEKACCSLDSSFDALKICDKLDIPFYVVNMEKEFEEEIIKDFKKEYKLGRTPNPCVRCNKFIKFGKFIDKAKELGATKIATGHYASILYDEDKNRYLIKKAKEKSKDQTYMLYTLSQERLRHVLFPLAKFDSKEEVRQIAKEIGFEVFNKSDSQDICFIPENDYVKFLKEEGMTFKKGEFQTLDGTVLGDHKGIQNYTIGQRKGLGLSGGPFYVNTIDSKNNIVYLGGKNELFSTGAIIKDVNIIYTDKVDPKDNLTAKVRYEKNEHICNVEQISEQKYKVVFKEKVRAITPGQSLVIYKDDYLYGGGVIDEVLMEGK